MLGNVTSTWWNSTWQRDITRRGERKRDRAECRKLVPFFFFVFDVAASHLDCISSWRFSAVQTEANNYFHALTRVYVSLVRGTMACTAIPPTALRMSIITQFDVCRNNAASRDSVTRRTRSKTTAREKKGQNQRVSRRSRFLRHDSRVSPNDSCFFLATLCRPR